MSLTFNHTNHRIGVPRADAQPLRMQSLINAIRDEEASERGIAYDVIATAAGKDTLGSGVTTGITVNLTSIWLLDFEEGAYQAAITDGNLADALARIANTGSPQVLIQSSAAATIVNSSGIEVPTPAQNAAAVLTALNTTTIPVDVTKINHVVLQGSGTSTDPMRPA